MLRGVRKNVIRLYFLKKTKSILSSPSLPLTQGPVRDQAILTLVEIYRHVGERARTDLMKKAAGAGIADARLRTITARFDEVRDARQMIADLDEG